MKLHLKHRRDFSAMLQQTPTATAFADFLAVQPN